MIGRAPEPAVPAWKRVLGLWPQAVRAFAFALAAFSLAWGLTTSGGLAAAMTGAVIGVVGGQRLARTRFKHSLLIAGIVVLFVATWGFARACVAFELVPTLLGPALTLSLVEVLRWAILPITVCALLRTAAVRRPTLVGLELAAVAIAVTTLFASHREGVISRPLWLADWAFRHDVDPAKMILGVGFVAAVLLATLLLAETKSGRGPSSLLVVFALAGIGLLCINAVGMPKPAPEVEAGRTDKQGDPPPPPPPGSAGAGGGHDKDDKKDDHGNPQGGSSGGSGAKPDHADGGGGGQSNDGGKSEGGSPPPPPPPSPPRLTEDPPNGGSPPSPVAVVLLGDDYSPPSQSYFFRQEALSQWNGTRFVATARGDADRDGAFTFPTEKTKVNDPPPAAGRVLVHQTIALLAEHPNPFGLEAPVSFAPATNPNPQRFIRAYKVESLSQQLDYQKLIGRKSGDPKWSPELRAYYTLGSTDKRYADLAAKYVKDLPEKYKDDPFAKAVIVKTHLDKELTYSTKVHYAGNDPTATFLFGNKIGYCVHFAHAAALLWRSLGIPARVATGYRADEDARKGGSALVIKGGDAHMWPELYLEGIGWVVLDIAAEKNLDPPSPPQDEDMQRLLGEMARNDSPDPEQPAPPVPHHYGRDFGIAGLALVALAAFVLYGTKIWRRFAPSLAGGKQLPRVGYRAALDMLAEVGLAREIGETREAFAERAAAKAPSFRELTQMHVAARLRDPQTPMAARAELTRTFWMPALARLRHELAAHTPTGRRFVGILNPASFLASR